MSENDRALHQQLWLPGFSLRPAKPQSSPEFQPFNSGLLIHEQRGCQEEQACSQVFEKRKSPQWSMKAKGMVSCISLDDLIFFLNGLNFSSIAQDFARYMMKTNLYSSHIIYQSMPSVMSVLAGHP